MFLSLLALWLMMSGFFKPLLLALGVASCLLTVWVTVRLRLLESLEGNNHILKVFPSVRYLFWLVIEIGKADWAVTKAILAPHGNLQQQFIKVPSEQKSDIARALYANSITITPGTVCVETEADHFIVHALTDEAANLDGLMEMAGQVSSLEKERH